MDFETIEKLRKKYPQRLTRGKSIKLYCQKLCCCGDYQSWANCSQKSCFLYPFRMGREENITEPKKISKKRVCSRNITKKEVVDSNITLHSHLNSNPQSNLGAYAQK